MFPFIFLYVASTILTAQCVDLICASITADVPWYAAAWRIVFATFVGPLAYIVSILSLGEVVRSF